MNTATQQQIDQATLHSLFFYLSDKGYFMRLTSSPGNYSPGDMAGHKPPKDRHGRNLNEYIQININYKPYRMHQLVWLYVYGYWPKHRIHHINGDKTDNRISNLIYQKDRAISFL